MLRHKLRAEKDSLVIQKYFVDLGIWDNINDGTLSTFPLEGSPSKTYPGGTSRILLHYDANNNHLATTHRITDEKTGHIFHWDAKGLLKDGVWLWCR
jgi:hypothetical protein